MPKHPWTLHACVGCAILISACATKPPTWPAAPRLETPAEAARPCELPRLPDRATVADLEIGFARRGAAIVACNAARQLAVDTLAAEHRLQDEARKSRR